MIILRTEDAVYNVSNMKRVKCKIKGFQVILDLDGDEEIFDLNTTSPEEMQEFKERLLWNIQVDLNEKEDFHYDFREVSKTPLKILLEEQIEEYVKC